MHGSVRGFSISTVKNIPQMKTIIGVYYKKKTCKTKGTQLRKSDKQYGGKGAHKCLGFWFFGEHKNKLA